jgi:hypothetical protein
VLGFGVYHHFQQYFSYIVVISFTGGGNRSTRRQPPTCRKTLTSFIIQLYRGGQFYWWRKLEYPEKNNDLLQVTKQIIM